MRNIAYLKRRIAVLPHTSHREEHVLTRRINGLYYWP
jgi:hypothetical protein